MFGIILWVDTVSQSHIHSRRVPIRRKFQVLTGSYVLAAVLALAFGPTPAAAETAVLAWTNPTCRLGGTRFGRCQVDDETGEPFCMYFYG